LSGILVEVLASIAPEAAKIVEKLQKAKLNSNQTLLAILAINLEISQKNEILMKQMDENSQAIRDVRADICNLKEVLARKGSI
jgi:hypothetical protein